MKLNVFVIVALAVMVIMVGCQKEGCTDSNALNYDSKAKKDNGTCVYPVQEPDLRDPYLGNYLVTDSSFMLDDFSQEKIYTLQITTGSTKSDTIYLNNLWNDGRAYIAIMSGNNFSIPSQQVDGPYYASGSGKFEDNSISYTTSGDVYMNKGVGIKQ